MNFYATKKFCDDLGYRLEIPRNQAENDALRDVTRDEHFTNWAVDVSKLNVPEGTDIPYSECKQYVCSMSNMKVAVFLKVL